jgi:threonine dehydrogenase-like Zn-dependent dehydrogenase
METMDALVWTGPRAMEMQRLPVPEPAAGELLIAVGAAGICGSELSGYLGENSLRVPPLVMGHEAAGTITAVNGGPLADGTPPKIGQRVAFNPMIHCGECDRCRAGKTGLCRNRRLLGAHRPGAFAQYVVVPSRLCFALPEQMSFTLGSLAEPLACGVRAAELAQVESGESLLILGAGPIGLCCLAAARARGVEEIYLSDVADRRLHVARAWGAAAGLNARAVDVIAAAKDLRPGGVDVVIDAVGTRATRDQALKAVVPGGRVVYIGLHEEHSPVEVNYLIRQEITVLGSFCYSLEQYARALGMLAAGGVQADDSWLEERPLSAGADSFAELVDGRARATKIVLLVD